jgi:hypothetical protein
MSGAAAVLTVGMLAVGCSDDGDSISLPSGIINNFDSFPASSIFSNMVWHDGGGFSPNDADLTGYRVIFSCDCCNSDGVFQGDNSAIVLFTTAGGGSNGGFTRLFVSHYNGSTFTPPTQLVGVDQDEQVAPGALNSIVALQLNTSDYTTSVQADQGRVAGNDNNWVVLYSATTFTNNPNNSITQVGTVGSTVGPHRTIYYTAFRKESRDIAQEIQSDFIGSANPVTLRFGWSQPIEVVPANARSGVASDTVSTGAGFQAVNTVASNVESFGLISDGYCGQTCFGGNGLPGTDAGASALNLAAATSYTRAVPRTSVGTAGGTLRAARFAVGERTSVVQLFYTQILNSLATGGPSLARGSVAGLNAQSNGRIAGFTASLNLTTLQFETPAELTPPAVRNQASSATTSPGTSFYPTFYGYNNHLFYKYMDASLNVFTNVDPLSIQPTTGVGYAYDNVGGHEGGIMNSTAYWEDICSVLTFVNDGDGTSSRATGANLDLSVHTSAAGVHDLVNPSVVGNVLQVAPNREMMNYNLAGGDKGFPFVFGADEGMGDTTVFYTLADNTRAGGVDSAQNNIVRGGYAAVLSTAGTFVAGGTNPTIWTTHRGAHHNNFLAGNTLTLGNEDIKKDPLVAPGGNSINGGDQNHDINANAVNDEDSQSVLASAWYFDACPNRTGEYIVLSYMQDEGTSINFHRALKVVTYQPFRAVASTTGAGTGGTQVGASLRFTPPLEISQTGAPVSITQDTAFVTNDINTNNAANVAERANAYNALPVNSYCIQGKCGYRCGIQSNRLIYHILWEQSDGTEDRLFSRRMTFSPQASGTPAAITLGNIVEYDTANTVAGNLNSNDMFSTFTKRATFTFLDRTFSPIFSSGVLFSGDLGAVDAAGNNAGSLFVVYCKISDATAESNGDFGNAEVILATVVNDTITNRISLARNVNEDQPLSVVTSAGMNNAVVPSNQTTNPARGTNAVGGTTFGLPAAYTGSGAGAGAGAVNTYQSQGIGGAYDTACVDVKCVPNNNDIVGSPNFQADAIYIYMTAPHSQATNGSSFTGLYTRKVNLVNFRTGTGSVLNTAIVPNAGTTGPGSAGFLEPTRLDHNIDGNVVGVACCQRGTAVVVLWRQDDHVWGQRSSDGENYQVQNGAPNPALVDQDTSADVINFSVTECDDGRGDCGDAAIGIEKFDFNGQSPGAGTAGAADLRLYFRASLQIS